MSLEPTTALFLSVIYKELINSIIFLSAFVVVIAIGLTSLIASIYYLHHTLDANFRDAQRILKTGAETEATVSYTNKTIIKEKPRSPDQIGYTNTYPGYKPQTDTYVFWSLEFEYIVVGKLQRHKLEYSNAKNVFYDLAKIEQWLDWRKLAKYVVSTSGQKAEVIAWPPNGGTFMFSGKLAGVPLLYDPIRPDSFVLPTFPPEPSIITRCFSLIETVVICLLLTVLYGVLVYYVFIGIILLIGDMEPPRNFLQLSWTNKDS